MNVAEIKRKILTFNGFTANIQAFRMPRKQSIEYPGAVYHMISRGNYRKDFFCYN